MVAVFRVDASTEIGIGHVMRSLSLAAGLKKQGAFCFFICKKYNGNLIEYIIGKGFDTRIIPEHDSLLLDIKRSLTFCREKNADVLIIDNYDLTEEYPATLQKEVKLLVSIDENAKGYFVSDFVLNQNFGIKKEDYRNKISPRTKLLLGPDFVLLRNEFPEKRLRKKVIPKLAGKILVSMGGGDANNQTLKVLKSIGNLSGSEIKTVLGPANKHVDSLKSYVKSHRMNVGLIKNCQDMSDLMLWADLAVSAGGSTCWELACLGVPTITMIELENQKRVVEEPHKQGILINLGWQEKVTEEKIKEIVADLCFNYQKRKEMSVKGRQLIDGLGVKRVVEEIYSRIK